MPVHITLGKHHFQFYSVISHNTRTMKEEKQKWLVLDDDGWTIIIPDFDSKPHSSDLSESKNKELSWIDCPCNPKVDLLGQVIIHNSFIDKEKVDNAITNLTT